MGVCAGEIWAEAGPSKVFSFGGNLIWQVQSFSSKSAAGELPEAKSTGPEAERAVRAVQP